MADPLKLICHKDKPERLLAELAIHELDLVLTDTPISGLTRVRAFSVHERFYAISVERRLKHPAVVAISEAARTQLFK